MKYWILTTEYPPFYGGGIGTYCVFTVRMLVQNGHAPTVFVPDPSVTDFREATVEGVRVVRFNTSRTRSASFLGHVTNLAYEFADIVRTFIAKEGRPDILESQEYLGIAYYLLQFKWLKYDWCRDLPVLVTIHSPSFLYLEYNHAPVDRYPNYWICEMERFCLKAADRVISPSAYMLEQIEQRLVFSDTPVPVIPNPFMRKSAERLEAAAPGRKDAPGDEIIFYGKLSVQKGSFHLLDYFVELWNSGFGQPLVLVAGQDIVYHPDGLAMGDIIRKKYRKFIDRGLIRMEDRIKPTDMRARLSRAAVVVIPSYHDNLPYVVFEMMSLGRIVLVSSQGGQAEVVRDGVEGFVFDHTVPGSFASKLLQAMDLGTTQREAMVQAAYDRLDQFCSLEVICKQKMPVIENMLARPLMDRPYPFTRPQAPVASGSPGPEAVPCLLTVVIPFYDLGHTLAETVASVQASIYDRLEILIVNDGSTDEESLRVLDGYRQRPGIRIIDTKNSGLGAARNTGARHATGEFLAFLDADDVVTPRYYQTAIRVLAAYQDVHFAGSWVQYFEGSSAVWPTFSPEPPLLLYHNVTNSSGLVYKRNSFLRAGTNREAMIFTGLEDYESVISMVGKGMNGVMIPEILFHYRVRQNSMIRAMTPVRKSALMAEIMQAHPAFYAKFAGGLLNLSNANGPGIYLDNPSLDLHLTDQFPFGKKFAKSIISLIKKNRLAKKVAYRIYKAIKK